MRERKGRVCFGEARRELYLEGLRRTANHEAAARHAGVSAAAARRCRQRVPSFDMLCGEAEREAQRRMAGAQGLDDGDLDPAFEGIRRSADGRLKIQALGSRRWSKAKEDFFFAVLRESGNIAASARAAGVSRVAVFKRRREWPAFARRVEETLDEAEVTLEFRVACLGTNWTEEAEAADRAEIAAMPAEPFNPELALRFLKWREEKRRGRRGATALPDVAEVRARILRKVEAIRRHRGSKG